jgi:hypothetical protein
VVTCEREEDGERFMEGPLHPDSRGVTFRDMSLGHYVCQLEVIVHGYDEVLRSPQLMIKPTVNPDPPILNVTVVGLEERIKGECHDQADHV